MTSAVVFMYSGQGSQYYDMGLELFRAEPAFRSAVEECDDSIRRLLGRSIIEALYGAVDKRAPYDDLIESHLALFTIQYSLTRLLRQWGVCPASAIGYSIGELIAYAAAGGIPLQRGLELARGQAELVWQQSPEAGMLAVLGPAALRSRIRSWCPSSWVAAYNFDGHFVVVARRPVLEGLQARLVEADTASHILPVHRGFHSGLIQHLEAPFRRLAKEQAWGATAWPVISSATAAPLIATTDHWWRVARDAIRFQRSVETVLAAGQQQLFVDLGPSGTLAGYVRRLLPPNSSCQVFPLLSRSGSDITRLAKLRHVLEIR